MRFTLKKKSCLQYYSYLYIILTIINQQTYKTMSKTLTIDQKLEAKLSSGLTCFTFRKKDGTIRSSAGTQDLSLIPEAHKPKTTFKTGGPTIPFYDFISCGVRSLKRDSLIRIACNITK